MFFGKRHIILFLVVFLGAIVTAVAQDYDYIQYTTDDGLPTNYVYGVTEDDEGYIWAYTENGVAKFDGYTFKNFSVNDGLPSNDIVFAKKGKDGKIWLHPYKSKPAYIEKDSIVVFSDELINEIAWVNEQLFYAYTVKSKFRIGSWLFYKDGKLEYPKKIVDATFLALYPNGFNFYPFQALESHSTKGFIGTLCNNVNLSKDSMCLISSKNANVFSFWIDDGFLYYSSSSEICYWSKGDRSKYFTLKGLNEKNQKSYEYTIGQLGNTDKFYFGIKHQLFYILDIKTEKLQQLELPPAFQAVKRFQPTTIQDSTIIINAPEGFIEYNFDGEIVDVLVFSELGEFFTLNTFFKDSKQNIWIGSREGGLFFIPNKCRTSRSIYSKYAKDRAFEQLISTADQQLLGITDNSGIYAIDEKSVKTIREANKGSRFRSAVRIPSGILLSNATEGGLLIQNDKSILEVVPIKAKVSSIKDCKSNEDIQCCSGQSAKLKSAFALSYNPNKDVIYHREFGFSIFEQKLKDLKFTSCFYIKKEVPVIIFHYSLSQQQLFVGNHDGLYYLENNNYLPIKNLQQQASLKNLSTLYTTEDELWIGTENNGLYKYSFSQQILEAVLDANFIRRIRPDTDSTLLVATNEGVFVINKNSSKQEANLAHYSTLEGLLSDEIQDVYSDNEQYIYVANSEGIQLIDRTAAYTSRLEESDLKLTHLKVNEQPVALDNSLRLAYNENDIHIQYHLMSFASNGKIKYYTKLAPLETEWSLTQARAVNYLELSTGSYQFHLKAEDAYGNMVEHPALNIEIKAAFWQTLWFSLLVAFAVLGLLFCIIYRRDEKNRLKLQQEKRINRRMAELELSALRAQMNPHFVFNALGAIQYHIQINEVEAADNYLTRFAKLMRKYLDSSKEKMLSLKQEVELLSIYTELEQLRFEDAFQVTIDIDENLSEEDVYLPSMLIQPFVENAINHGLTERRDEHGILSIQFYKKDKALYCEIKDNGIGRKNAKKNRRKGHKSRGMTIIREKVQTLRLSGISDVTITINDLYAGEEQFPGTAVVLTIKNLEDEDL